MLPTGYKARFEHLAAPIEKYADGKAVLDVETGKPKRLHSKLVAGSAAPLFLDMWYSAFADFIEHPRRLAHPSLPNRRTFQFMTTLPAPILLHPTEIEDNPSKPRILPHERRKATTSSLYMPFTKPFEIDLENLYSRETNELIAPFLEGGLALATVAQRVRGYFKHGEAKSQGSVGLLTRKCVAGLSKVWVGKESHPLANGLVRQAGVDRIAKAARVDTAISHRRGSAWHFEGALGADSKLSIMVKLQNT